MSSKTASFVYRKMFSRWRWSGYLTKKQTYFISFQGWNLLNVYNDTNAFWHTNFTLMHFGIFLCFAESLSSFSVPHSSHRHSNLMMARTGAVPTVLDPLGDRSAFSLEHHHARTPFRLAAKAARRDVLANQCWSHQGISVTWNQFETEDKYLFSSHQSWQVNPHC